MPLQELRAHHWHTFLRIEQARTNLVTYNGCFYEARSCALPSGAEAGNLPGLQQPRPDGQTFSHGHFRTCSGRIPRACWARQLYILTRQCSLLRRSCCQHRSSISASRADKARFGRVLFTPGRPTLLSTGSMMISCDKGLRDVKGRGTASEQTDQKA